MGLRHTIVTTSLGELTVVATAHSICGVYFPSHTPAPHPEALGSLVVPTSPLFMDTAAELNAFIDGKIKSFTIPYEFPKTTDFNLRVWERVAGIPYGKTTTYGLIASELGQPKSARAVGRAVGANPLSIIVPCHRVLGADGKLTGYAGGVERKSYLLQLEAAKSIGEDSLF
ncbi:methylated-DNA--[protein]-cysteine S-methyltransferase [Actinomycetaceae bacterium TAE3-ERU4]|nr:methylated-DNA--[protein]-cysteine S-methyltransferase [Actinomycetaceae bacterium TAE3-ERU4]